MEFCVLQIIWILLIHLWFSRLVTSNSDENNIDCFLSIMVPRNTVWKACVTNSLEINCTIFSRSNCWNVNATWCRIKDNDCGPVNRSSETRWKSFNETTQMMFLKFENISMRDAGLYRCQIKSSTPSVSHGINVTVTDNISDCSSASDIVSQEYNTTTESLNPKAENSFWLQSYVYICSGVAVLICLVIVVSVIVIWCRGQKKLMKTIKENQSAETPVADHPPPIYPRRSSCKSKTLSAQISSSPSCTYDTPPSRVTSLKDCSSAGKCPVNQGPQRQCHDRELEEKNPLIYATLNHSAVPQRPARVTHVQMEESEYAVVKVS